jgi:putative transposase
MERVQAAAARRAYQGFLAEGVGMGKRADFIGGGLVRSAGGWEQVSLARHFGEHLKSDERILGDSDFVNEVLGCAQEEMEKTSLLHSHGLDLDQLSSIR